MQLTHNDHHPTDKSIASLDALVLIAEKISAPANCGGLFRLADAFGVNQLILDAHTAPDIKSNRLKRTARATEQWINHEYCDNILEKIKELKNQGYLIAAIEITSKSQLISNIDFSKFPKIALILGNENFGVSKNVLENCEMHLHIKMRGNNSSMNVTHAAALALYEVTRNLN